jgi:hypothetical protein
VPACAGHLPAQTLSLIRVIRRTRQRRARPAGLLEHNPLSAFFPTISAAYSGNPGSVLANGTRAPTQNVAATMMSIGNPSYPALKAVQECCSMWDGWGRQAIEGYLVALAQYLRARLVGIWGPRCLAAAYDPSKPNYARVGLTGFNPFSPGYDFNAVLSVAEASAQTTVSGNAVTALRDVCGVVVRNTTARTACAAIRRRVPKPPQARRPARTRCGSRPTCSIAPATSIA